MSRTLHLTLPWAPSVNHYWRFTPRGVLISRAGREYREKVGWCVGHARGAFTKADRLLMLVLACPPDRRIRNLDNINKAVWDALQHAGVYADDDQIDDYRVRRGPPGAGKLFIKLTQLEANLTQEAGLEWLKEGTA